VAITIVSINYSSNELSTIDNSLDAMGDWACTTDHIVITGANHCFGQYADVAISDFSAKIAINNYCL
jgi:hypothetical protein